MNRLRFVLRILSVLAVLFAFFYMAISWGDGGGVFVVSFLIGLGLFAFSFRKGEKGNLLWIIAWVALFVIFFILPAILLFLLT